MGAWTSFLNLFKPDRTDSYNVITQQDDNWDKIDAAVDSLNSNIGQLSGLISPLKSSIVDAINSLLYANSARTEYNADANDYTEPGVYYFATGCSNVPSDYSLILNISHSTLVVQLGVTASRDKLYLRGYASGSWSAWKSISFT